MKTIEDNEFLLRKQQLEDIQARANMEGDLRSELAAIQEINKLCGLYNTAAEVDTDENAGCARQHLEGLNIAPRGLALEELARRVAAEFEFRKGMKNQEEMCTKPRIKSKKTTRDVKAR